jgi:hypothetical protein
MELSSFRELLKMVIAISVFTKPFDFRQFIEFLVIEDINVETHLQVYHLNIIIDRMGRFEKLRQN